MRPATHLQKVSLVFVAMVVIATAAILAAQNRFHSGQATATSAAPQDQPAKGNPWAHHVADRLAQRVS